MDDRTKRHEEMRVLLSEPKMHNFALVQAVHALVDELGDKEEKLAQYHPLKVMEQKPTMDDVLELHDQPVREMWHPDYMDVVVKAHAALCEQIDALEGEIKKRRESARKVAKYARGAGFLKKSVRGWREEAQSTRMKVESAECQRVPKELGQNRDQGVKVPHDFRVGEKVEFSVGPAGAIPSRTGVVLEAGIQEFKVKDDITGNAWWYSQPSTNNPGHWLALHHIHRVGAEKQTVPQAEDSTLKQLRQFNSEIELAECQRLLKEVGQHRDDWKEQYWTSREEINNLRAEHDKTKRKVADLATAEEAIASCEAEVKTRKKQLKKALKLLGLR